MRLYIRLYIRHHIHQNIQNMLHKKHHIHRNNRHMLYCNWCYNQCILYIHSRIQIHILQKTFRIVFPFRGGELSRQRLKGTC